MVGRSWPLLPIGSRICKFLAGFYYQLSTLCFQGCCAICKVVCLQSPLKRILRGITVWMNSINRCCYTTMDFATAASQNGFSITQQMYHLWSYFTIALHQNERNTKFNGFWNFIKSISFLIKEFLWVRNPFLDEAVAKSAVMLQHQLRYDYIRGSLRMNFTRRFKKCKPIRKKELK